MADASADSLPHRNLARDVLTRDAALLAKELGVRAISLSLTHTGSLAMATVVMED